ncbi:MAG: apolipoprotein N-acyltransferase [Candidatus Eremiobacteraeota bacterium]|nr:apolipoprotein N-acyltransferase [Candidatus Eremiobacteraeota bacterium]
MTARVRSIVTSIRPLDWVIAAISGTALALAFPKFNLPWLAPLGAAGLFWLCQRLSWRRVFFVVWFGATLFFCITFSWFGYTVGSFVGKLAFALVLVPALAEGAYVAASAVLAAFAFNWVRVPLAPLAAAAAFTIFEWLRSIGPIGVPFGQLGYSQGNTPLAVFAAYIGCFGITFVICVIGAYLAQAIVLRRNQFLLTALAVMVVAWFICWWTWPARHASAPAFRVAAIQGNIAQATKWHSPGALQRAIARYTELTTRTGAYRATLVVWPETVITTVLSNDPNLQRSLGALARQQGTTLAIGSINEHGGEDFNSLFVFAPDGRLAYVYDKRQLVPFAEGFPGRAFLSWIPYTNLITGFGTGTEDSIFHAGGVAFAPLICWESAFADLTHAQLKAGAQAFVIVTDDAWFGKTAGPYQHAQIAQLRAIETGTWILRAASTGVSGIIAPNGRYVQHTDLDREAVVLGAIGQPVGSVFAHLGPTRLLLGIVLLYAGLMLAGRRAAH